MWIETIEAATSTCPPWDAIPAICNIPGSDSSHILAEDIFHCGPLGSNRGANASSVVLLMSFGQFTPSEGSKAVPFKLQCAFNQFKKTCIDMGWGRPKIREFTRCNFGWTTSAFFPEVGCHGQLAFFARLGFNATCGPKLTSFPNLSGLGFVDFQ